MLLELPAYHAGGRSVGEGDGCDEVLLWMACGLYDRMACMDGMHSYWDGAKAGASQNRVNQN